MKIKLIAIDTEFNSNRELLSLGYYSKNNKGEIYFKNKVDSRTFKIHCLPYSFLEKTSEKNNFLKEFNKKITNDYNYIIGFDIYTDLEVIGLRKIGKLYSDKKIIDIKSLFDAISLQVSLFDFSDFVKLNDSLLHTSFFDSKLTFKLIDFFYEKIFKFNGFSFEDYLSFLSNLTYVFNFGQVWDKEEISLELNFLQDYFKSFKRLEKKEDKIDLIILKDKKIFIFNKNKECLYLFDFIYFNSENNYEIFNIEEHSDYIFPEIGNKFLKNLLKKDIIISNYK